MPSPKRGYIAAALVLIGIGGFAYSVVLIGQVLIGAGFTLSALVVAALVYYGDAERHTLTRATIAVTVVYGVLRVSCRWLSSPPVLSTSLRGSPDLTARSTHLTQRYSRLHKRLPMSRNTLIDSLGLLY